MKIDFASLQNQLNFEKHHVDNVKPTTSSINNNYLHQQNATSAIGHQHSHMNIQSNQLYFLKQQSIQKNSIFAQKAAIQKNKRLPKQIQYIKQKQIKVQRQKQKQMQKKKENQRQRQKIKISVMYPYEISKSLSPQHYKRQITYLEKQNIIPQSALKYIQKEVENQIMKTNSNSRNEPNKEEKDQSKIKILQKDQAIITDQNNQNAKKGKNISNNYDKLNYFSSFGLKNKKQAKGKKYDFIKPKIQTRKNQILQLPSNKNHFQYQRSLQISKQKSIQQQMILIQKSRKSILRQTANSKVMKKVIKKRQIQYQTHKTNVYNKLYQNSSYVQLRKKFKREQQNQNLDNQHQKQKFSYSKKYTAAVKGTFFQRLQKSIQKIGYKQRVYRAYDMTSRKIMFQPDVLQSKRSYQKLFKRTLQKNKNSGLHKQETQFYNQNEENFKNEHKDKSYTRNDRATTRMSSKAKTPFQSTKRSLYNSFQKDQKKSVSLNKSLQIVQNFNSKVTQRVTNIFYPESFSYFNKTNNNIDGYNLQQKQNEKKKEKTYNNNQITIFDSISHRQIKANHQRQLQQQSPQDFVKTVQSFSELTQQQYHILEPLFNKIQLLQKSTRISRIMFKNLLINYIKKLNLYDQMVLREPVQVQRKKERLLHSFSKEKEYIQSSIHKKHLNNIFLLQNQFTHTPIINIRSQSLQKLVSHHEKLYFV